MKVSNVMDEQQLSDDPAKIDLDALKKTMTPVSDFHWAHWFNKVVILIAAVEALREREVAWQPIEYGGNKHRIELHSKPPFDGKPVLIRTNTGVVEAWWKDWEATTNLEDPNDGDGWLWVCYDDKFTCELDDATHWQPLLDPPKDTP